MSLGERRRGRVVRCLPAPASSNPACRFPALGFPVCFTSRVMGPIRAGWLSADGSNDPVLVKQPECVIEPRRTPPLPAESWTLPGAHQVPPNLLLHPELNVGKAPARVPYRKLVHPTPQNRIDEFDHPPYRLTDVSPADFLELLPPRPPLLQL